MRDLRTLPKAHLHVHLESAVRWSTLAEIAGSHDIAVPRHLMDGTHRFTGFGDFFDQNDLVRACLQRPADFSRIALEFCEDQAADGVRYAEVSFTAAGHGERLGDLEMPLASVLDGLSEGRDRYGIECRVLIDHSRRRSVERAWRTLELAVKYAADGVVAIGLAGDEEYRLEPFIEVFQAAKDKGLGIVHHAGEACGPESIRAAIGPGLADRIGHGIRIVEDPDLLAEVRERRIPLEVCPSSNVALGFVPSLTEHPLRELREAGLVVTVNTDIPALIHTGLSEEYSRVKEAFGYTDEIMAELARNGVDASFAPESTKIRLREEIDRWR